MKINVITSILLVLVIVVSSFSWKPKEAVDQGPVYSGSLWRGMIPVEYLSYRTLEGKLSFDKISTPREFIVGVDQTETRMVNSTTYTITTHDTGSIYYLVTDEHKPITDHGTGTSWTLQPCTSRETSSTTWPPMGGS